MPCCSRPIVSVTMPTKVWCLKSELISAVWTQLCEACMHKLWESDSSSTQDSQQSSSAFNSGRELSLSLLKSSQV